MAADKLLRFSRQLLGRALRLRCPRCGEGKIFRRLLTYSEYGSCPRCGLRYDPRGESLAFMYVSTAFLTGVMVVVSRMILRRRGTGFLRLGACPEDEAPSVQGPLAGFGKWLRQVLKAPCRFRKYPGITIK